MLAFLVSFHYNIYQNRVKLANFQISYLNKRNRRKLVPLNTFCVYLRTIFCCSVIIAFWRCFKGVYKGLKLSNTRELKS